MNWNVLKAQAHFLTSRDPMKLNKLQKEHFLKTEPFLSNVPLGKRELHCSLQPMEGELTLKFVILTFNQLESMLYKHFSQQNSLKNVKSKEDVQDKEILDHSDWYY